MFHTPATFGPPRMVGPPRMFGGRGAAAATGVESEWCVSFDGVDDSISIPDSTVWDFGTSDFTLAMWVNLAAYDTSGTFLMHQQNGVSVGGFEWYISTGNRMYFNPNAGTTIVSAVHTPSFGTWSHYAVTRSGTLFTLWIDGVSIGSATNAMSITDVSGVVNIGKWSGNNNYHFNGRIDDVRVYSRALDATEVAALYTNTSPPTDVTAYLPLEEGTGTTTAVKDGTGATIATATLTNGPTWHPQTPPKLVSGRNAFTRSLSFDGTDDYVDLGTTNWLSGTAASLSFWCQFTGSSATQRLFAKEPSDYLTPFSFYNNLIFFTSKTAGGSTFVEVPSGAIGLNNGSWHNVIVTVDSSYARMYCDGILVNTVAWTHGILASTARTVLGASEYFGLVRFFYAGKLSDVRGYASTLSVSDVEKLARGQNPTTNDPVGWWKGDETSGTLVADYGSGGNDGTCVGGVTRSTDVPAWLAP